MTNNHLIRHALRALLNVHWFNCIQLFPQLHKTYITKSVEDLSLYSLIIILITNILWLLHGYYINDRPLFFSALTSLAINIPLVCLYVKHRKYHDE